VRAPSPQAREVLEQILATSHAERSATETWHEHHPDQPVPLGRESHALDVARPPHRPLGLTASPERPAPGR
jgi:hypothetical protein